MTKTLRFILVGLTLFSTAASWAAEDEFGGTTIAIQGCSSEGHHAVVFYRVSNFSPWDMNLPEGTVRASMQETWDAANIAFHQAFQKVISRHLDAEIARPNFAADLALEAVGERLGRMDSAFYETKKLLYDQGKYTALSVNYEKSGSSVDKTISCKNREQLVFMSNFYGDSSLQYNSPLFPTPTWPPHYDYHHSEPCPGYKHWARARAPRDSWYLGCGHTVSQAQDAALRACAKDHLKKSCNLTAWSVD